MNVMITGYGKMGKLIEEILTQRGHTVACRVDKGGYGDYTAVTKENLHGVDAVIEFALPQGMEESIKLYSENGISTVVGTTGWDDKKKVITDIVKQNSGSFLYGTNFSIGANIFFNLVSKAADLINLTPDYDIMMLEYHHKQKKDSPSGTALTTANRIIEKCKKKDTIWTNKLDREIKENELNVASVRGGHIPGIHAVTLDSIADSIEIKHTARNRYGFALGAVMAAEWLIGREGFYQVEDFMNDFLKEK